MNNTNQIDHFGTFLHETAVCMELSQDLEKHLIALRNSLTADQDSENDGNWERLFDTD